MLAVAGLPVERPRPALGEGFRPALRQPQQRLGVATVLNELHQFRVGHQTVGEPERLGQHAVTRSLAVEREAHSVVADLADSHLEVGEGERRKDCGLDRHRGRVAVGWPDRILREQVEDVREQKLLVPPLVVAIELDQLSDLPGWTQAKQAGDCLVDMGPVDVDFVQCRLRDHAAPRTRLLRPECLVVGIEQEREPLIERPVALQVGRENHRHKKPGRVREVPLRRARIGHRLQRCVRVGKRFTEPLARGPDLAVESLKVAERERELEKMRRGHCISSR